MNSLAYQEREEMPATDAVERRRGRAQFRSLAGSPCREYYLHVASTADERSPVVVLVHGITRNAAEHVSGFSAVAEQAGAILIAPLFTKEAYGQYQQLADPRSGIRADLALLDILEAAARETGASTDRIYLFGFSGGAQFAHRFMMLYPERIGGVAVAAAGWYTFPDQQLPYPLGIKSSPLPGRRADPARFLAVARHVFVGDRDISRDRSLRTSRKLDGLQGETRLARARTWFDAMEREAGRAGSTAPSSFTLLKKTGHSFANAAQQGLAEAVFNRFGLLSITSS